MSSTTFTDHDGSGYDPTLRLPEATRLVENAWSLVDHLDGEYSRFDLYRWRSYDDAVEEFQKALSIRESLLGRYHKETAKVYNGIGYSYYKKSNHSYSKQKYTDKSLGAYHTALRIRRYLSEGDDDHQDDGTTRLGSNLKGLLRSTKGYSRTQMEEYSLAMTESIEFEKAGDLKRTQGDYEMAIANYQTAIAVEMDRMPFLAHYNPVVSFLARKIALVVGVKSDITMTEAGWERADRINLTWLNDLNNGLYQKICEDIRHGDQLYASFKYQQAKEEYHKASLTKEELFAGRDPNLLVTDKNNNNYKKNSCRNSDFDDVDGLLKKQHQNEMLQVITNSFNVATKDILKEIEKIVGTTRQRIVKEENSSYDDDDVLKHLSRMFFKKHHEDFFHLMSQNTKEAQRDVVNLIGQLFHDKLGNFTTTNVTSQGTEEPPPMKLQDDEQRNKPNPKYDETLEALEKLTMTLQTMYAAPSQPGTTAAGNLYYATSRVGGSSKMDMEQLTEKFYVEHIVIVSMLLLVLLLVIANFILMIWNMSSPSRRQNRNDSNQQAPKKMDAITSCDLDREQEKTASSTIESSEESMNSSCPPQTLTTKPTTTKSDDGLTWKQDVAGIDVSCQVGSPNQQEHQQRIHELLETCQTSVGTALERILQLMEEENFQQAKEEMEHFVQVEDAFWKQLQNGMTRSPASMNEIYTVTPNEVPNTN